ncbi:MAG: zf-HC2 domain-containing protein [Acidobacteriota bacterium]
MLCKKAKKKLSQYFDGVLDSRSSIEISNHLNECDSCREDLAGLLKLHSRLSSIEKIEIPDFVYPLIQTQLKNEVNKKWLDRMKDAAELRWSRIRTTGFQFYWTKALGTLMAAFCFSMISSSIDPFYPTGSTSPNASQYLSREYSEQIRSAISINFGRFPIEQYQKSNQHFPAIDDQYYLPFWDSIPETTHEEDFSVVFAVDPSGTVRAENVLEYPDDETLLQSLNVIEFARGRPGSLNGKYVPSPMVVNFNYSTVTPPSE